MTNVNELLRRTLAEGEAWKQAAKDRSESYIEDNDTAFKEAHEYLERLDKALAARTALGATKAEFVHPEYVGDNPVCPVCGSYEWEQGPRGGNSVIKCKNGHWWNNGPFGIQRIKSGATQKEEKND